MFFQKSQSGVIKVDETMLRVLADNKSSSKKKKNSDDTLMDLLAKMSEAYMKSKQENAELAKRVKVLESENFVLKKQLAEKDEKKAKKDDMELEKAKILQKAQMLLDQTQNELGNNTNLLFQDKEDVEEKRNIKRLATPDDEKQSGDKEDLKEAKDDDEKWEYGRRNRSESRERKRSESRERKRSESKEKDRSESRERKRSNSRERRRDERYSDERYHDNRYQDNRYQDDRYGGKRDYYKDRWRGNKDYDDRGGRR